MNDLLTNSFASEKIKKYFCANIRNIQAKTTEKAFKFDITGRFVLINMKQVCYIGPGHSFLTLSLWEAMTLRIFQGCKYKYDAITRQIYMHLQTKQTKVLSK